MKRENEKDTMTYRKKNITACLMGLVCLFSLPAFADGNVLTRIKVIHASTGSRHVDPQLKNISSELNSVFRYTAYRLLSEKKMRLGFDEKGRVSLPGGRTLVVSPADMQKKRIRYHINILKNKRSVFKTQVLLRNNSSISIGGPRFKKGVLIFNITGRTR